MAGTSSDSGVGKSLEGALSGEALAEWRSSEQTENGITSTSPPYWDTDDEEDYGPKPSDMYNSHTWKVENFSKINKRELRSNEFEAGNYKWYILIYPKGCDVCNHLSLFLCVANHDKLRPGWSHFAQFTISVVNKDPKKTKYSDTLHRFWKKEHDWGWKKFMELSKILEGFVDDDQLTIKAQVQVIREKPDRPFRCLDIPYRKILVGVYLTNVEQICRRFVEEKRNKLVQLREDKARWSSFRAFWIAIDQSTRQQMCREKADTVLRAIVKQFFIDKEVASTLVMDSLYSGLRALEDQSKGKVGSREILNAEERSSPIVHVEDDMFVLMDDVLKLFGRASMEPLSPKDGKGPQNRMKDGFIENCSKDFNELSERRLTEIGRRTIEIFVLAHIFGKIEVAYQEDVSLKRQEELIREEAVWLAGIEQRVKHGVSEKEKKLKKKQAKQKRNNRKGKDKGKPEKFSAAIEDDSQPDSSYDDKEERKGAVAECLFNKINKPEKFVDVSDSVSCLPEFPSPGCEEREASWDTDALETHPPTDASSSGVSGHSGVQRGTREKNNPCLVDDSSSTCSTDSVPCVLMNGGLYSGYSLPKPRNRKTLNRIKNQRGTATINGFGYYDEAPNRQPEATSGASTLIGACGSGKAESQSKVAALSLNGRKIVDHHMTKKDKVVSSQREPSTKAQAIENKPLKEKTIIVPPSLSTPSKIMSFTVPVKSKSKIFGPTTPIVTSKPSPVFQAQAERATSVINTADSTNTVKHEAHKVIPKKPTNKPSVHPLPVVSRPLSAPIVPGPKPSTPIVSHVQTPPVLSRSSSVAGCLGPVTSPSYIPLSYRNAIMGITQSQSQSSVSSIDPSHSHTQVSNFPSSLCNPLQSHTQVSHSPSSSLYPSQSHTQVSSSPSSLFYPSQLHSQKSSPPISPLDPSNSHTQTPNLMSASLSSSLSLERIEPVSLNPSSSFRVVDQKENINIPGLVNTSQTRSQERLSHSGLGEDFPHLDIINNLLDEEQSFYMESLHSQSSGDSQLPRHVSFPLDISGMSSELVAASTSSCRFDQDYYYDGYQLGYGSLAGNFNSLDYVNMIPQINPGLYVNEPIDGLILSQWPMTGGDMSYNNWTNAEVDSYPYNFLQNANLAYSVIDYTAFEPSNAH